MDEADEERDVSGNIQKGYGAKEKISQEVPFQYRVLGGNAACAKVLYHTKLRQANIFSTQ